MDDSPPGSSLHKILQVRILERVAMPFSRGSSHPRNWTWVSCIAGRFLNVWATREALRLSQFSSVTQSCLILCDPMHCSMPGLPAHHQFSEPTQTNACRVGTTIQPSHPLSSPSSPTFNLSQHQSLFKWVSLHIRWPKYWSFSFNISPSNEYSGLISFRMDWLDLLEVQGILKNLPQHHSSKASILLHSAFFIVQLSHLTWLLEKP